MSSKDNKIKLVWNDWNREHIKKHKVKVSEVKQAYKNKIFVRGSYLSRMIVFGKTNKGRLLTIVLSFEKQKDGYIVSVRDTSKKEREDLK
jgi:uncharacterized DUF497 family protein